ncbi:MAG: leucine-rich repeat domain-containing protein, partial [Muribaculaceae bacterium]|nr:leucine-rich repeat domain-containing protein [Muribaculaceae bacterium]
MTYARLTRLSCTLLCCAAAIQASAFTVNAFPGCLHEALADMPDDETRLEITGSIDVRDFEPLRGLTGVEKLDLSEVRIAEHASPTPLFPGRTWFEADCLPPYSLFETSFTDIILPASIVRIEEGALASSGISRLEVPAKVKEIGDYAFYNASSLTAVTLPVSLGKIGRWCFNGCSALKDLNLEGTSVTELPDYCFSGTYALKKLDTSRILTVGREVFSGSGLTYAFFPKAREFAPFALYGMEALEGVSVP